MTLPEVSRAQWDAYQSGDPFPHIVLDDLFPVDALDAVLAEFPRPGDIDWRRFNSPRENKLGMKTDNPIGDRSKQFLYYLNSAPGPFTRTTTCSWWRRRQLGAVDL